MRGVKIPKYSLKDLTKEERSQKYIKKFLLAFRKLFKPTNCDITVLRGTNGFGLLKKNSIVTENAFMSCSLDLNTATGFNYPFGGSKRSGICCLFVIRVMKGTKVLAVGNKQEFNTTEREIILTDKCQFQVTHIFRKVILLVEPFIESKEDRDIAPTIWRRMDIVELVQV